MTTYAYDTSNHQLVAVWDTGIGATSCQVALLHPTTDVTVGLRLAHALTRMSEAVWLSYTSPEVVGLPAVAARRALLHPHLPQAGLLCVEDDPVVESAHRVGRQLRAVGSADVTRAVTADVQEEMEAADNADRGELSGRARQAVMLTRVTPSPAQIAVADRLLHDVPMGSVRLYTEIEPAAAAVAAIHWFLAAVTVLAEQAGTTGEDVLDQAEYVQYFDPAVPRAVLRMSADGPDRTPLAIARKLLHAAVLASRGMILAADAPVQDEPCFTALDPARPARCLLDGLVGGIQTLAALHATTSVTPETDPEGGDEEWMEPARRHFEAAVRAEAAARAAERLAELAVPVA